MGAPIPQGDCAGSGVECARFKWEVLCDNGTAPATSFLRCYLVDCESGIIDATVDYELDGFNPYVVIGDVGYCGGDINIPPPNIVDAEVVCFDAPPSPLIRISVYDSQTGDLVAGPFWRDPLTGAPAVPAGSVIPCPDAEIDVEIKCLCDDGFDPLQPFIRVFTYNDGVLTDVSDFELDGTTPYVVAGVAVLCDGSVGGGSCQVLCDAGNADFQFVRCYSVTASGTVNVTDIDIDGNPYVVIGPVGDCPCPECVDPEILVLCDDGTSPFTSFLRRYDIDSVGVVSVVDTELDGTTAYVLVGSAVVCPPSASGLLLTNGTVNIFGVGSWILGVDDGGGSVKSVTFSALRAGSVGPPPAAGSITVTDGFGNTETLFPGQTKTWEVDSGEDALTGTLRVDTTAAPDIVTVLWTEV